MDNTFWDFFNNVNVENSQAYFYDTLSMTGITYGAAYFIISIGFTIVYYKLYNLVSQPVMQKAFPELKGRIG